MRSHDDVINWKHFPRNWPFVNSPHKGQWRGALMFSLICVWINDWVNNREAGDLRRYRAHYDVIVMIWMLWCHHTVDDFVPTQTFQKSTFVQPILPRKADTTGQRLHRCNIDCDRLRLISYFNFNCSLTLMRFYVEELVFQISFEIILNHLDISVNDTSMQIRIRDLLMIQNMI